MKRYLKRIIPILLCLVILCSLAWYLLVYDRDIMQDALLHTGQFFENRENHRMALWLYHQAYSVSGKDDQVIIELADRFKKMGNYTQAEVVLTDAIKAGGGIDLYMALSRTYVEQDKLLDAMGMLESITNPQIKSELEALRPAAPTVSPAPGYYTEYRDITLTSPTGDVLCVATGDNFPSVSDLYDAPITLVGGENSINAITIGENGLVSAPAYFSYIVGGVIEEITISDPVLDAHLRTLLDMTGSDTLYSNNLWTITSLEVPEGVTDLSDLSRLVYLEKLEINNLENINLQFLRSMPLLKELTVRGCPLSATDLTTISALPVLENLVLSDCSLINISGLSGAKSLVNLDLSNNAIQDLTPLSFMHKLTTLNLSNNALTNLSAISALENLAGLDVSYNSLTSILPLRGCPKLVSLSAANNQLTEIPLFDDPTLLTMLVLSSNNLTDVSTLANYTSLSVLSLSYNQLADVSALSSLEKLAYVDISHNEITKLPTWSKTCDLVQLDASYNKLTSVSPLRGLKKLNYVYLDSNWLSSINPLAECEMLVEVSAFNNSIKDVSKLTAMSIIVRYNPL